MTSELTETELQEQMISADRGDIAQTNARVLQQRAREKQEQAKGADQDSPWREPTTDKIQDEQRILGTSFNDARNALRRRLAADARRLKSAAPSAADEITLALSAADEAKRAAEEMLEARQVVLNNLESQIYQLGNLRLQIRLVQSLAMDAPRKKAVAHRALSFFLAKQGGGLCAETEGGWQSSLKDLSYLSALDPYIQEFIEKMEIQAKGIIAGIRATAADNKINLKDFMAFLAGECGRRPGINLSPDSSLYQGLF